MYDASDLLPPAVLSRIIERLRKFRESGGFGCVQLHVEHGYISRVGGCDSEKLPFDKETKQIKA